MTKLFGTDGIRGKANIHPMTCDLAVRVGRATGMYFKGSENVQRRMVIGKDTRLSGDMIEYALSSGVCSSGFHAFLVGVLPTPAIAYLCTQLKATAGMVVSASHNPYYDNGIKLFRGNGFKLIDEVEEEIERLIHHPGEAAVEEVGQVFHVADALEKYILFLRQSVEPAFTLEQKKIVLDCANGSTYQAAPGLFRTLGANVVALSIEPDGKNINERCGSEHPEELIASVLKEKADIGLAFDGDGDRLIAVDETGEVVSGDVIIAIMAAHLKKKGLLENNTVVTTVMSNMGLGLFLRKLGISHATSSVGDRYVMEEMLKKRSILGGEDSGHIILLKHQSTGDGILAALKLLEVMESEKKTLSELKRIITIFPQKLVNIDVSAKPPIDTAYEIKKAIEDAERKLGDKGRVLVRYSGTQMKCRVMVEAPTVAEIDEYCEKIAHVIRKCIGS